MTQRPLRLLRPLALLLLWTAAALPAEAQRELRGLDDYIERGMRQWEVPGVAVAVVEGDSVVFARGFGVRELGRPEPVDARTIFAIGSATKAFTAAAVGMLVDAGEVRWDDPAAEHLPGFQLFDPYASRELTVRDLLTHRSGLERGDLLWYGSEYGRDEVLRRVRFLEPARGFRSAFGYQNIMFLAAGQIVPAETGKSWDEFVNERIFAPLGMEESGTTIGALEGRPNVARPHARLEGRVEPVPYRNVDNVAPAGAVNSNALEMARWVELQLAGGAFRGKRLLKEETLAEMHTPQTVMRLSDGWSEYLPGAHLAAYGMGWMLSDYRGRKVVQHGGNIDGMHAMVGMLPEEELGVVVLTNLSPNRLATAVMYRVFDAYLGGPRTDWSSRLKASADSLQALAETRRAGLEAARVAGTSPSLPLAEYAGTYRDPMYGDATVSLEDGRLVLRRGPAFAGELEHWHYDIFRAAWRDRTLERGFVTFSLGPMGRARKMEVEGIAEFERVPSAPDPVPPPPAPAEWSGLVGVYLDGADTVSVLERGGRLLLLARGAELSLSGEGGDAFRVGGEGMLSGRTLRFARDPDGKAALAVAGRDTLRAIAAGTEGGANFRIDPMRPVEELRAEALAAAPPEESVPFREPELVEPTALDPTIRLDVRYATENNFMGARFYQEPRAFLQRPAAEALARASRRLRERGYGLLIHDAYRPWYVTKMFWDATPESQKAFVADPAAGSRHNRGAAVDLSLYWLDSGESVEMPSGYDEFSPRAYPDYPGGTSRQRWHRALLRGAMEAEGFSVYDAEWWHFDFGDWRRYPILDLRFEEIPARR